MKSSIQLSLIFVCLQASTVLSQLVLPNTISKSLKEPVAQQEPIMNIPNVLLPPASRKDGSSGNSGDLSLSDVIGKEGVINIFAGFTSKPIKQFSAYHFLTLSSGDIETISRRLDDNSQNTTVLAPLNSELQKLPRKPWENPKDYNSLGEQAYEGASGEDRAHRNLRRFVEAHVVPVSPWKEGEKVDSIGGGKVWWELRDDKKIVGIGHSGVSISTENLMLRYCRSNLGTSRSQA